MPIVNGKRVLASDPAYQATLNERGGLNKNPNPTQTSAGTNLQPTVSADTLANPPSKVTPPVPQVNTNDGSRTQGLINNVANNNQQFIQSESENARRRDELAGILGEQTFDASGQRTQLNEQYGVPDNLSRLTDIQTQLTRANTDSNVQKTQIAGAAGQTIGQAQRELTQQDRENAVRNAGLAAEAAVLQGSIETASTLINQAMSDFYQDRQLTNQNMIQQLNYFSGLAEGETKQLIQKETRKYEEDQLNIARALNSVDAAVATGIASNKDIETMTALAGNPAAQKEYADKIVATAARRNYQLKLAQVNAARSAAAASARSEQGAAAKTNAVSTQAAVDTISNIRNNPLGIKAITGAFGAGRTAISAALGAATQGFVGGTAAGAAAGSVVPGLGTIAGGAVGGVAGFATGLLGGSVAAANQRTNVASDLSYLVNDATFSEMRRLKEGGVTFGALTEGERIAIGRAADNLFSALDVAADGTVNGVRLTEDKFYALLDNYEQKRLVYQEQLNRNAAGMVDEDYQLIENAGQ